MSPSETSPTLDLSDARVLVRLALDMAAKVVAETTADPGAPILGHVCTALDALVRAAMVDPDVLKNNAQARTLLATAVLDMTPAVVGAVQDKMPEDQITLGLAMASGVLTGTDDPLWLDRLIHVAAFRSELQLYILRKHIRARGDPVRRRLDIARAVGAVRTSEMRMQ